MDDTDFDQEIDDLLRTSLAGPVPELSSDFERRVRRQISSKSQFVGRFRRTLFVGYLLISAAISIVVMSSSGVGWLPIACAVAPLVLGIAYGAKRNEVTNETV